MKTKYIILIVLCLQAFTLCAQRNADFRKGFKRYKALKYAEAIPYFMSSVAADTSEETVYYLATSYRKINDYENAANWYAKLVKKERWAQDEDYYYYGIVLKNQGKYQEAMAQFQKYKEKRPGDPAADQMLASCRYAIQLQNSQENYVPARLPNLNSDKDDYAPTRYNKGFIIATSRYGTTGEETNPRSGQPYTDMYYVDGFTDKEFGVPKSFDYELNTESEDGPAVFDPKTRTLYFSRAVNKYVNPDLNADGIYVLKIFSSTMNEDGTWTKPEVLPFCSNRYNTTHPALSPDGETLYFTCDRKYGAGGKDLYMSRKNGDSWSMMHYLGDTVNTPGDEAFPYIHKDGALFFSSNYHSGMGGLDVFRAAPVDEDGKRFKDVRNLGKGINSSADDFGVVFSDDGEKGYLSSNRLGGSGNDDIYFFVKYVAPPPPPPTEPDFVVINGRVVEQTTAVTPQGNFDYKKGGGVGNASVVLSKNNAKLQQKYSGADGRFAFQIEEPKPAERLTVSATKAGRLNGEETLTGAQVAQGKQVEIGLEKIVISNIMFCLNCHTLSDSAMRKLDKVAQILRENPGVKLEMSGYTCPLASDQYNYGLSKKRSSSVIDYLESKGVSGNRVTFYWEGEEDEDLVSSERKEYGKNRRTEFNVVYPGQNYTKEQHYHVVQEGETLYRIAKNNGTTVKDLMILNNLPNDKVSPGQRIKIRKY